MNDIYVFRYIRTIEICQFYTSLKCFAQRSRLLKWTFQIKDYVVEKDIDILALTETWLKDNVNSDFVIRDVCPSGYRSGRSGGGVIYKSALKLERCKSFFFF
jgi:hypothetical protein